MDRDKGHLPPWPVLPLGPIVQLWCQWTEMQELESHLPILWIARQRPEKSSQPCQLPRGPNIVTQTSQGLLQMDAAIPSRMGHREGWILDLGCSLRPFCTLPMQGTEG